MINRLSRADNCDAGAAGSDTTPQVPCRFLATPPPDCCDRRTVNLVLAQMPQDAQFYEQSQEVPPPSAEQKALGQTAGSTEPSLASRSHRTNTLLGSKTSAASHDSGGARLVNGWCAAGAPVVRGWYAAGARVEEGGKKAWVHSVCGTQGRRTPKCIAVAALGGQPWRQ